MSKFLKESFIVNYFCFEMLLMKFGARWWSFIKSPIRNLKYILKYNINSLKVMIRIFPVSVSFKFNRLSIRNLSSKVFDIPKFTLWQSLVPNSALIDQINNGIFIITYLLNFQSKTWLPFIHQFENV